MQNKPVYIVTAPSGAGKTTLNRRLCQNHPEIYVSISLTTRSKRQDEKDGDHYWFVRHEDFLKQVKSHQMLEWADVHGALYGTSLEEIQRINRLGGKPILEIDVHGWMQAREKLKIPEPIFIFPPTFKDLAKRLYGRNTDSDESCKRRLKNALSELQYAKYYHYFIVNDDLEVSYKELKSIIVDNRPSLRLSKSKGIEFCKNLISQYDEDLFDQIREELRLE